MPSLGLTRILSYSIENQIETHDSTPLISEQSNSKMHKHAYSSTVEILFVPMLDFTETF